MQGWNRKEVVIQLAFGLNSLAPRRRIAALLRLDFDQGQHLEELGTIFLSSFRMSWLKSFRHLQA